MFRLTSGRLKALAVLMLGAIAFLCISSPDGVVVNRTGEVAGVVNSGRELLQGRRFWERQLHLARAELEWQRTQPARDAAFKREDGKMMRDLKNTMEDAYQENPGMRPSPASAQADALRDAANELEHAEIEQMLEAARLRRIADLIAILPVVEARNR